MTSYLVATEFAVTQLLRLLQGIARHAVDGHAQRVTLINIKTVIARNRSLFCSHVYQYAKDTTSHKIPPYPVIEFLSRNGLHSVGRVNRYGDGHFQVVA